MWLHDQIWREGKGNKDVAPNESGDSATADCAEARTRVDEWEISQPGSRPALFSDLCRQCSWCFRFRFPSTVHYNIPPTLLNTSQSLFLPLSSAYSSILSLLHPNSFIEILFPAPASSEFSPLYRSVPAQFRINQRQQRSPCQYPPTLLRISWNIPHRPVFTIKSPKSSLCATNFELIRSLTLFKCYAVRSKYQRISLQNMEFDQPRHP